MRTVRRLIFRAVAWRTALVAVAFSGLAFFIDFVEASEDIGQNGYTLADAVYTCLLMLVRHVHDLMPIAVLIGGILALARMAQTSEFTILRTGGLSPARALRMLALFGLMAAVLVAVVGNWLVPIAEQQLTRQKAAFSSDQQVTLGRAGTWLREKRDVPGQGAHTFTVNVGSAINEGEFGQVRIFEFDGQGELKRRLAAGTARVIPNPAPGVDDGSVWQLKDVIDTRWLSHERLTQDAALGGIKVIDERKHASMDWVSSLTPVVVTASVLPPESMSVPALWRYTRHLDLNAQAAQRYEMQFWKKLVYPFVCFVMIALALPFAYLHARSGGMSLKIFGGIMLGISFILVNHIASHLGQLQNWQPWLAAMAPSLLYTLLSMSVFAWLVRRQ